MTKEPRIYNGERIVFSIIGVGKTGHTHTHTHTNETGPLCITQYTKINSKWIKTWT